MRRFRLSTLMLLVVIAALGVALVVQERRATRREAELQAQLTRARLEAALRLTQAEWVTTALEVELVPRLEGIFQPEPKR
jgi:hypothetical protein